MVFQTVVNMVRSRGPDEFWRKRKVFQMSAHFIGRRRNCFSVAIKQVHRALAYATTGRKLKKLDMQDMWQTRIAAGSEQFGISSDAFQTSLVRSNILLNRKVLADLAIWEPQTFETIARIARERAVEDGLDGVKERNTTDNRVFLAGDAAERKE